MSARAELEDLIAPWVTSPDERAALAIAIERLFRDDQSTGVKSDNHALLVGRVMGTLIKGDDYSGGSFHPLRPEPVMRGSDYTNKILLHQPSGKYLVTVEPVDGT